MADDEEGEVRRRTDAGQGKGEVDEGELMVGGGDCPAAVVGVGLRWLKRLRWVSCRCALLPARPTADGAQRRPTRAERRGSR